MESSIAEFLRRQSACELLPMDIVRSCVHGCLRHVRIGVCVCVCACVCPWMGDDTTCDTLLS